VGELSERGFCTWGFILEGYVAFRGDTDTAHKGCMNDCRAPCGPLAPSKTQGPRHP